MNDEARQVNDFIAEKVMGWHKYSLAGGDAWVTKYYLPHEPLIDDKDIVWCNHYDPFHNVAQAIEAADKWCDDHKPATWTVSRRKWYDRGSDDLYVAKLTRGKEGTIEDEYYTLYGASTPEAALCLVLRKAVEAK